MVAMSIGGHSIEGHILREHRWDFLIEIALICIDTVCSDRTGGGQVFGDQRGIAEHMVALCLGKKTPENEKRSLFLGR